MLVKKNTEVNIALCTSETPSALIPILSNSSSHGCKKGKPFLKIMSGVDSREYDIDASMDLSCIPVNNGAESWSGWIKIQETYENVWFIVRVVFHYNLSA